MSAYLNTRVSLYSSRLWQGDQFQALLRAAEGDIPPLLAAGGLTQLADILPGKDQSSLEQSIIARLLDETVVLLRPLSGDARAFLLYWTERFEVSNLKTLLRGKMTGERPAVLLNRLTPMGGFARLDAQELAHAEDVTELLRRLEAGHYARIVRTARLAFEDSRDPFLLDAVLDREYYEGLARRARALEQTLPALARLMAPLIDRINLVWLLRYRFNYLLPPAQVYYLLVAAHYALPVSRLKALAAQDSLEAALATLPPPLHALLAGVRGIPEVFSRMEQEAARTAARVLRSNAPALVRAYAYLILRERNLRAVRAVMRGRNLGLDANLIGDTLGGMTEALH
ncbi:MAG: V-type ATPase subunit [Betaproteobacteria bacterium]|nr:V-type ATPase subunit [Betaproteobacteria bacterium]